MNHIERITMDPDICHGKPTIRGLRYPVKMILQLLSSGMTIDDILTDYESRKGRYSRNPVGKWPVIPALCRNPLLLCGNPGDSCIRRNDMLIFLDFPTGFLAALSFAARLIQVKRIDQALV